MLKLYESNASTLNLKRVKSIERRRWEGHGVVHRCSRKTSSMGAGNEYG
jgi:hypothetical protein